jgi:hypothetical protein
MKLWDYPERNETIIDENLFKEREKSLPENIKKVKDAKAYLLNFLTKAQQLDAKPTNIQDVNTGYIYILSDCIAFAENKRLLNDKIKEWINDQVYKKMTMNWWYNGTVAIAEMLVSAFFDPETNKDIRSIEDLWSLYLTRDAREQWYRICNYVLKYLEWYAKDHRLGKKTKKELVEILW